MDDQLDLFEFAPPVFIDAEDTLLLAAEHLEEALAVIWDPTISNDDKNVRFCLLVGEARGILHAYEKAAGLLKEEEEPVAETAVASGR